MLLALVALNLVLLLVAVALLLRGPKPAEDARLAELLAADLPRQLARAEGRTEALEAAVRQNLEGLRAEAQRSREDAEKAAAALRDEVLRSIQALGKTLGDGLDGFRLGSSQQFRELRSDVERQMNTLSDRFGAFASEAARTHLENREALQRSVKELQASQAEQQEKLRGAVEQRLEKLNADNSAKLDEMRLTVDEKLHATLETRLAASFGQVTDQLTKVHAGLGEMNTLSAGVNDLNRIFSNVKSRGGFAEVQLGNLLDQVLAPGQYVRNAHVKPGSQEVVEYAVCFPGAAGEVLLPIDAKFPREDWERLESAYERGSAEEVEAARRAFDAAIRTEGKRICSKYINEPLTTPYAIMFLPTESLYAEVLRRDGLQNELHLQCKVMIAGPSTLYALLTSFQLGFRMLNLQKKGDEVWKTLAKTQTEFKNFELLMNSMEKQVGTVQNTIQKLGVRTRAINRTLRDVGEGENGDAKVLSGTGLETNGNGHSGAHAGFDGLLPMLAAEEED